MRPITESGFVRLCCAIAFLCSPFFAMSTPARAQGSGSGTSVVTREWTWVGGSSNTNQPGVYGTLGTPAAGNIPGGREYASTWTDSSGNLWLFGGDGYDANDAHIYLNDLWEFSPSTNEWTWIDGSSTAGNGGSRPGVYGTLGTSSASNIPGGRSQASSGIDSSGNLWLFGGYGLDSNGNAGNLNDMWKYNPATNEWTWMGGSNVMDQPGVYGTLGMPASGNIPGSRNSASSWTDSSGNLWFFGGSNYDGSNGDYLDDLWEFNPSANEWTWMGGNNGPTCFYGCCAPGNYGILGTPAAPGCRILASSSTDISGNLWLFGGKGFFAPFDVTYNELWEFNPSTNEWALKRGPLNCEQTGPSPDSPLICNYNPVYGASGVPAAGNLPGSRSGASSWTDSGGDFWLFGGVGYDASANVGSLGDLWEFTPSSNEWVWIDGSSTAGPPGVYGTLGTPAAGNIPGSREGATSWTDSSGNLWLFGGEGSDASGNSGSLNDLWKYVPAATPVVTVTASSSTITTAQQLTVAISVSGKDGTPTGSVTLTSGSYSSAAAALSSGTASIVIPAGSLATGTDTVAATYTPDAASYPTYYSGSNTTAVMVTAPTFTVGGTAVSVVPGATSGNTSIITLTPAGGFTGSVTLTAAVTSSPAGAQDPPTLSFGSTSPVSITGTTAATATLAISTTAATSAALAYPKRFGVPWHLTGSATLACILLFGIRTQRRSWRTMLGMLMFLVALAGGISACSSGGGGGGGGMSNPGTTAGAYTVTVTGTSGTTNATNTITLTVQ